MTPYMRVVEALERRGARRSGKDWTCPAHEDGRPSLTVNEGTDGRVLLDCKARCSTEDVMAALGMSMRDLFPPKEDAAIVAVYDYVDEHGELLSQVVRYWPKDFRQRRPDGNGGWVWNLNGARRVPFHLADLLKGINRGDPAYVVEGEKDVQAVEAAGAVATCNPGGVGKWRDEFSRYFRSARVTVVADQDEQGHRHANQVAASLRAAGANVQVVSPAVGKDASDHLAAGKGLSEFVPVQSLAAMKDEQVSDAPAPVPQLAVILADVEAFLRRFVVFPARSQSIAAALWVAHTHTIEAAEVTPYLAVTSPEKRSGKTRLLEVIELLVPRPLRTANISDAALFRSISESESGRCAILLDEADATFSPKSLREDLRALLNAGYRRGAYVVRVEMQGKIAVTRRFDAFGAKIIASIGPLPDTVADRSIPIRLQRRTRSEYVQRFRLREATAGAAFLQQELASWAASPEVLETLREARPSLPDELDDRAQDGWEPLLAIADAAGAEWPSLARAAAIELHTGEQDEESTRILLLRHVRDAFAEMDRLSTGELLRALCDRDDGPWVGWWGDAVEAGRTKGPGAKLSRILRPFGIKSKAIRTATGTRRGYDRAQFETAWARYLDGPENPPSPSRSLLERNNATSQLEGQIQTQQPETWLRPKTPPEQASCVVASLEGGKGRGGESGASSAPLEEVAPGPEDVLRAAEALAWPAAHAGRVIVGAGEKAWKAHLSRPRDSAALAATYGELEAIDQGGRP